MAGAEGVNQAREVRLPHPSDARITVVLRACCRAAEAVLAAALNKIPVASPKERRVGCERLQALPNKGLLRCGSPRGHVHTGQQKVVPTPAHTHGNKAAISCALHVAHREGPMVGSQQSRADENGHAAMGTAGSCCCWCRRRLAGRLGLGARPRGMCPVRRPACKGGSDFGQREHRQVGLLQENNVITLPAPHGRCCPSLERVRKTTGVMGPNS